MFAQQATAQFRWLRSEISDGGVECQEKHNSKGTSLLRAPEQRAHVPRSAAPPHETAVVGNLVCEVCACCIGVGSWVGRHGAPRSGINVLHYRYAGRCGALEALSSGRSGVIEIGVTGGLLRHL